MDQKDVLPKQTLTPPPPKEVPSKEVQKPDDSDEDKSESLANKNLSGSIEENVPSTNEPIKPSSAYMPKFNPAILAIVGGIVVLIAAGIAYYTLVLNKQPLTVSEETPPAETQPDVTTKPPVDIVEDTEQVNISDDETIQELDTVVESNDLKEIEDTLNSLDFEGIDTEIQQSNF